MKVKLSPDDFQSISVTLKQQLKDLLPDNELCQQTDFLFGPEFMAPTLRIFTPATQYDFATDQTKFVRELRKRINNDALLSKQDRYNKHQQLDSIILFGQILFAQSASFHFLEQTKNKLPSQSVTEKTSEQLKKQFQILHELIAQEGILMESSRLEALKRRQEFKKKYATAVKLIDDLYPKDHKLSIVEKLNKKDMLSDLYKTRGFYYQVNDLNFKYALKPSRCFSRFVNHCENYGSKIALTASIIALVATSLSFIPVLTPIMAPIALVASAISLSIGLPIALKNLGTMLYNLLRFGVEPTPGELIGTAMLASSFVLSGATIAISQAVSTGALQQTANLITQQVSNAKNVTGISLGVAGWISGVSASKNIQTYKNQVEKTLNSTSDEPDSSHTDSDLAAN